MIDKIKFLILFLSVLVQTPDVFSYNLRKMTNLENLSNNSVTFLCQDEKGLIWIGTCDGLNVYNGDKVSLFRSDNQSDALSGNLIDKIVNTGGDILWVQSYYGIDRLNKSKRTLRNFNQFNKRLFTVKDLHGNFYILQKDGCLFYYKDEESDFCKIDLPKIKFNDTQFFHVDSQNTMWILNKNGEALSYKIKQDSDKNIVLEEGLKFQHNRNIVFCSAYDNGLLFVDDEYHLFELDTQGYKKSFVTDVKELFEENGFASSMVKFHDDYFIGFKTKGLFRLKKDMCGYTTEKLPINSGIFCLLKDKYQDIIWIGTDGQGVYSYLNDSYSIRSIPFNNFTFKMSRPVRAVFKDSEHTLWLGSKGDGIVKIYNYNIDKNIFDCKTEYISTDNSALLDNSVYSIVGSNKEVIWIGTEEGLNYYSMKDKKIKKVNIDDGSSVRFIHDIYEQDSVLWLASVGMGIIKLNLKWVGDTPHLTFDRRFVVNRGDMSSNYFFSFFVDGETIWAANRGSGVFKLNTRTASFENLVFNSNTLNEIYTISKDDDDNYLIGTSSGLIKFKDMDHYKVIDKTSGFPSNVIHSIQREKDGTFWLSTNSGIINYNSKDDSFRKYNYLDGLEVFEFSDGASFNNEETGGLFFGGINGFVFILENENYVVGDYMPSIYFDNLTIFGKEHVVSDFLLKDKEGETLTLNYNENFYSITVNAIDYINGGNYNYYYKLDKIGSQWVNNGNSGTISLTNFSPGEYTLLVKYYNMALGVESSVYRLNIIVLPPWYETRLAYAIYSVISLILAGMFLRTLMIRQNKKKLKSLRILEQKHKEEVYESKLSFFTNIAHEFCTPLTLIVGPCSRILSQKNLDSATIKYAEIIQHNADRLNLLIQDLIEFRRVDTGHKKINIESVEISKLITHIANSFTHLAESKKITFEYGPLPSFIWNIDKEFLFTIISNLLSNAFKYTFDNGIVRIGVEKIGEELHISISNIGEGIEKEDIATIFDRYSVLEDFETQTDYLSRNGLGLAISNSLVNLLGGRIDIESTMNEWTHFIVKLPVLALQEGQLPVVASHLPEEIGYKENLGITISQSVYDMSKPTLLIIDDEPEILWLIRDVFMDEFNVLTATNAEDGLTVLKDVHLDVILCDVMMPNLDGIAFTKQIKSNPEVAHIPLILISEKHEIEKQIESVNAGAELYITKPFNTDYLKISVKQLITKKEALKDYFASPKSAYELTQGKFKLKEHKKFVNEILDIINGNIQEKDLNVNFIAKKMNMSARSLFRKMKEISDESISNMIRDCRLHIARDLLIKSELTVEEIVFKSGFTNKVSFFKAFAKKYDCTPKEYREQNKS